MYHASAPLIRQPQHHRDEVVDFLVESVEHFERELGRARREIRQKRAQLEVLRIETDRLREDAEQWGEIANREGTDLVDSRNAHRKLIEKSRGIAALGRLCEMLERDLAKLEPKLKEDDLAIDGLRQQLRHHQHTAAAILARFSAPGRPGATLR